MRRGSVALRRAQRAVAAFRRFIPAGMIALAGACSGPSEATPGVPPGTTHAQPAEPRGLAGDPDPDALWAALAGAEGPAEILRAADALSRAGQALGEEETARVFRAADAAAASQLGAMWPELGDSGPAAAAIALRLAKTAHHRGDARAARVWLRRVDGDPELEDAAAELEDEILAEPNVRPGRVAVLLPLSGRHADLGEEIRRGAELAAEHGGGELVFVDTRGEPAGAMAAVGEAAERRAAVIMGPVGREESAAATARAVALGIPVGVLSPLAEGSAGANVFRLWSSPATEARAAARLAGELRYDRAGILAPRSEGGRERAEAFSDEAARLGIEITEEGYYDPTGTEIEPDVRAFLGLDPATDDRLSRHLRRHGPDGWKTYVPDFGADLVYLPDRHDRAALVASFFPYFNVEVRTGPFMDVRELRHKYGEIPPVVQLLGSPGWLDPSLIPRGGDAVQGALIVGVCRDVVGLDRVGRAFVSAFEARHGREPGDVAAQAFDAAALALKAAEAAAGAEGAPREAAGDALARAEITDGACGPGRVRQGALVRDAPIFEVEGEDILRYRD